jgi:predicted dehydrogenase
LEEVSGLLHTFIKKRPLAGEIDANLGAKASTEMGDVTVDDAAMFLAKFKNGALGTFEASRSRSAARITTGSRSTAAREASSGSSSD